MLALVAAAALLSAPSALSLIRVVPTRSIRALALAAALALVSAPSVLLSTNSR